LPRRDFRASLRAMSTITRFLAAAAAFLAAGSPLPAQRAIGDWHGKLDAGATSLRLGLSFTSDKDGKFAGFLVSPDEGFQFRLNAVTFAGGKLSFEERQNGAHFTAKWDAARKGWDGMWTQGQTQPLFLKPGRLPDSPDSTPNPLIARYADTRHAARLADGRRINMVCTGQGKPTVLFNAGAGNWSAVWQRVEPAIARQTRACTWDRAGFGFSPASKAPQTVAETTSDLEQALRANKIAGPFIIVAHSLGGLEALLFADRNKAAVAGMVLVDPSIPDATARLARVAPTLGQTEARPSPAVAYFNACADALERRPADAPSCTFYDANVPRSVFVTLSDMDRSPARIRTRASLFENMPKDMTLAIDAKRDYGTMPLIVLSAGKSIASPQGASAAAQADSGHLRTEWTKGQTELAALSRRGEQRLVPESDHYIQLRRPDLVIAAVNQILAEARTPKHH
jgi:pimeloyl-ACP methyl ester carboxylesterase